MLTRNSQPKKWKIPVIVWITIVPLIFTIIPVFKPLLLAIGQNEIITELILTTVLAILMVYLAQPFLMKLFRNWLNN